MSSHLSEGTSCFRAAHLAMTHWDDPFLCRAEAKRFRADFPEAPTTPIFLFGNESATCLTVLAGTLRRFGIDLQNRDRLHASLFEPAVPRAFPLDVAKDQTVQVVIGPAEDGSMRETPYLIPEARSDLSAEVWERYVWDHEIAHTMVEKVPTFLSPKNYGECVADAYALLRAWQRGQEVDQLEEDVITERRLLGLVDHQHDTEDAIRQVRIWVQENPEKRAKASPQELFDKATEIAASSAMSYAHYRFFKQACEPVNCSSDTLQWDALIACHRFCLRPAEDPDLAARQERFKQAIRKIGDRCGLQNESLATCLTHCFIPPLDMDSAQKALQTYLETYFSFHKPEKRALRLEAIQQNAQAVFDRKVPLKTASANFLFRLHGGANPEGRLCEEEKSSLEVPSSKMDRALPGLRERLEETLTRAEGQQRLQTPDGQKIFLDEALNAFRERAAQKAEQLMDIRKVSINERPRSFGQSISPRSQRP